MVLAGDSLSLWFPSELLPTESIWLNQGISGETSAGLLQRLHLFDATQPETVFVMIGINDLIRGARAETVLANQREIVRHLKSVHPRARIVIQSILPHGDRYSPDRSRDTVPQSYLQLPALSDRLAGVPNDSIRALNQQLAAMAKEEKVEYLDLSLYFSDTEGNLRPDLSTDGLHLSPQGYWTWATHLKQFSQSSKKANISERSP